MDLPNRAVSAETFFESIGLRVSLLSNILGIVLIPQGEKLESEKIITFSDPLISQAKLNGVYA